MAVFRLAVRLEDLKPGSSVRGLVAGEVATVVHVEPYGEGTVNVTYRTASGQVGDRLLFRRDEPELAIAEGGTALSFTGDPALYKLIAEARRIRLAHLFDPMVAIAASEVEPLPHRRTKSSPSTARCCRGSRCATSWPTTRAPARRSRLDC